jgi:hypothetical protein
VFASREISGDGFPDQGGARLLGLPPEVGQLAKLAIWNIDKAAHCNPQD